MHPKARESINKALANGLMGSNRECKYYPCHNKDESYRNSDAQMQDCTFCFCPFYPCMDSLTGGRFKISEKTGREVWSCIACTWIHRAEISGAVLNEIKKISHNVDEIDSEKLREIRLKILEERK